MWQRYGAKEMGNSRTPGGDGVPPLERDVLTEADLLDLLAIVGPLPLSLVVSLGGRSASELQHRGAISVAAVDDGLGAGSLVVGQRLGASLASTERQILLRRVLALIEFSDVAPLPPESAAALGRAVVEMHGKERRTLMSGIRACLVLGRIDDAKNLVSHALMVFPDDVDVAHLASMTFEAAGQHGPATTIGPITTPDPAWVGRWWANRTVSLRGAPAPPPPVVGDDRNRELRATQAWVEILSGDIAAVAATTSVVLDDPLSSAQAIVWVCAAGSLGAALDGRTDVARRLVDHGVQTVHFHAERLTPFAALQMDIARYLSGVRLGLASQSVRFAEERIAGAASDFLRLAWTALSALALREAGRFGEACVALDASLGFFPDDNFGLVTWARSERSVCATMSGQEVSDNHRLEPLDLYRACVLRNDAWISAAVGDVVAAKRLTLESLSTAQRLGQRAHVLLATIDLARFGDIERAQDALGSVDDRDAPLTVLARFAIRSFAGADVDISVRAAVIARACGVEPLASELALRARRLAARVSPTVGARTELWTDAHAAQSPLLKAVDTSSVFLTPRERTIARLAAEGATSRAIGDILGISVRTVDNQLGRAYRACGVSNRAELAATAPAERSTTHFGPTVYS
jgi:DNA-binding CsgD family transcriptional regulator